MQEIEQRREQLPSIWSLPPNDTDFSVRWGLIKATFSRSIEKGERISQSRQKRGERGLWQRRFWEHQIRDEADFHRHIDYIHWNPVKHGWVRHVVDWPHSSFHVYLERGIYPKHWCGTLIYRMFRLVNNAIDAVRTSAIAPWVALLPAFMQSSPHPTELC